MNLECNEKDCKKVKTNRTKEDKADSCSCYEVNMAAESLKKLLYDIHNANQETFVDHSRDLSSDNLSEFYYSTETLFRFIYCYELCRLFRKACEF